MHEKQTDRDRHKKLSSSPFAVMLSRHQGTSLRGNIWRSVGEIFWGVVGRWGGEYPGECSGELSGWGMGRKRTGDITVSLPLLLSISVLDAASGFGLCI